MSQFIEKEKALLAKLKETNYEFFDNDREEAFEFLETRLKALPKYVNTVVKESIMLPIWRDRYDGQELRDKIQDMDAKRKIVHDKAIASLTALNRLSQNLGLGLFADIDTNDRHAVAEYVGEAVNIVYNEGIGNQEGQAFDNAVLKAAETRTEYDEKRMAEEMRKFDMNCAAIESKEKDELIPEV